MSEPERGQYVPVRRYALVDGGHRMVTDDDDVRTLAIFSDPAWAQTIVATLNAANVAAHPEVAFERQRREDVIAEFGRQIKVLERDRVRHAALRTLLDSAVRRAFGSADGVTNAQIRHDLRGHNAETHLALLVAELETVRMLSGITRDDNEEGTG